MLMTTRRHTMVTAAIAAVVLALGACGPDEEPEPGPTTPPPGTPGGGSLGEPPAPPPATSSDTMAVYYVGDELVVREGAGAQEQPRLYREFRTLEVGDGSLSARLAAAVGHALTPGSALDPDFRSGWPNTAEVVSVEVSGSTATVDLSGAASHTVGSEAAHIAVQQLVWTATAVPEVDTVMLTLDGAPAADLWGHVAADAPLTREPPAQVLALLWLISPQHGQTVPGTFEVHIYGAPFEATAQLRVRDGATVVHEQFVTLGGAGFPEHFGEAKVDLTLDPGTYTLEVYEQSAVDGTEIRLDDKVITVG
jgi:hypothetical protein